jgi:hypothetical protein
MKRHVFYTFILTGMFSVVFFWISQFNGQTAQAVSAADWRAGNIISDNLFYDNSSMSVSEIQDFLNKLVPHCDTQGSQPAREFGRADISRAEYARRVGWPGPPYVCLKDYYQVPRNDQIINNYSGHRPAGSISAAEIIKRAADTYRVSPKALLVLLQKESPGPLPIDIWPLQSQYRNAMGSGCPDTAPCDPRLAGFYNQMMSGAERFRVYYDNPGSFRHKAGRNNLVYFHPDLQRCGNSQVYIESRATAGLYNYTPYQPNQAALNNLNGTGDSCSAYGNRNFWRIYNSWFGSTQANHVQLSYESLETPRWMKLSRDLRKRDPRTGQEIEGILPAGSQLRFQDKVRVGDTWYLRTQWDKDNNQIKGVPQSELIDPSFEPMQEPRWMKVAQSVRKVVPRTDTPVEGYLPKGAELEFVDKYVINETVYLRTKWDAENGLEKGIVINALENINFEKLDSPIWLETSTQTEKINPITHEKNLNLPAGMQLQLVDKVTFRGTTLYRTAWDAERGNNSAIIVDNLQKIPFKQIENTKKQALQKTTNKINPYVERTGDGPFAKDTAVELKSKVVINGVTYYRTVWDTAHNNEQAFPESLLVPSE